jgi:hypothetical protein
MYNKGKSIHVPSGVRSSRREVVHGNLPELAWLTSGSLPSPNSMHASLDSNKLVDEKRVDPSSIPFQMLHHWGTQFARDFLLRPLMSRIKNLLPPSLNISIHSIQTQKITELVKDIYTPHFILSTNSPPTHQLFIFVLIHRNTYIVSKILNLRNANIKGRREYDSHVALESRGGNFVMGLRLRRARWRRCLRLHANLPWTPTKTACKTRGGVGNRQDYSMQERREDPAFISVRLRLRLRAPLVRHALALPPPAAALLSGHATWALPGDEIASESIGGVCVGLPITILCCACSEVQWKRSSAGAHVGRVRLFHGSTRLRCQVRKGGTRFYSRCNFWRAMAGVLPFSL